MKFTPRHQEEIYIGHYQIVLTGKRQIYPSSFNLWPSLFIGKMVTHPKVIMSSRMK